MRQRVQDALLVYELVRSLPRQWVLPGGGGSWRGSCRLQVDGESHGLRKLCLFYLVKSGTFFLTSSINQLFPYLSQDGQVYFLVYILQIFHG